MNSLLLLRLFLLAQQLLQAPNEDHNEQFVPGLLNWYRHRWQIEMFASRNQLFHQPSLHRHWVCFIQIIYHILNCIIKEWHSVSQLVDVYKNLFLVISAQTLFLKVWIGNNSYSPLLTLHPVILKKTMLQKSLQKIAYLATTPWKLKFGLIVTSELPPSSPASMCILYDKKPVPTAVFAGTSAVWERRTRWQWKMSESSRWLKVYLDWIPLLFIVYLKETIIKHQSGRLK